VSAKTLYGTAPVIGALGPTTASPRTVSSQSIVLVYGQLDEMRHRGSLNVVPKASVSTRR
jgi:hypothetical protein